ncbi:MAG TPA: DUF3330 domain-containing protein [Gammaproteobacteria bacterium]
MKEATETTDAPLVSCHICQLEVPHAEALSVEGQEYLYYFCGQGCYSQWQQEHNNASSNHRH